MLGSWDVKLTDLDILENEIRDNPVVDRYFNEPDRGSHIIAPPIPKEVKEVYQKISASERSLNVLNIGIKNIIDLKNILQNNPNFEMEEGMKELIKTGVDFYKVTLIADFRTDNKWKFKNASINIHVNSETKGGLPKIYSIAPERIEEKTKITKKFGVSPSMKLLDQEINPGLSLDYTEEYETVSQLIVGHYFVGQQAWWDFLTGRSITEIEGIQKLELIIIQPSKTKTKWKILPTGVMEWQGRISRFVNKLLLRKPEVANSAEVSFSVPM